MRDESLTSGGFCAVLGVADEGTADMSHYGSYLVAFSGQKLDGAESAAVGLFYDLVACLGECAAACNCGFILGGVLGKPQCYGIFVSFGGTLGETEVKLMNLPLADGFVHDSESGGVFGAYYEAFCVGVNAVAEGRSKALLVFGNVFAFII